MTTHSGRAGLRTVDDAVDRLIEQLVDQFREARAEHNVAAAKMKAEFNAEIAELRRELRAEHDAIVAQIKSVFEKDLATLQGQLAQAPRGAIHSISAGEQQERHDRPHS